jgi:hypothetical protein
MPHPSVHTQSERFKQGFAAGFYDAISDDGARYLDDVMRYGVRDVTHAEFIHGYRYGRLSRRGDHGDTLPAPPLPFLRAA